MGRPKTYATAIEHFNAIVIKKENGCWELNVAPNPNGYKKFKVNGVQILSHVFAYENFVGSVPVGKQVHHKCERKLCCNPEHLQALTRREHNEKHNNSICTLNLNKTHCDHGHEFTPENTGQQKNGRFCKACVKIKLANRPSRAMTPLERFVNAFSKIKPKLD